MEVAALEAGLLDVGGEIFGEALGERGDEDSLTGGDALFDLVEQVGDLALGGVDFDFGIDQTRGADDLLDDFTAGVFELVFAGCGGDEDDPARTLAPECFELFEAERAVIQGAGKPEAVLDEDLLALAVAVVHRLELGDGDVALVDDHEVVFGKIVEEGVGRGSPGLRPSR